MLNSAECCSPECHFAKYNCAHCHSSAFSCDECHTDERCRAMGHSPERSCPLYANIDVLSVILSSIVQLNSSFFPVALS